MKLYKTIIEASIEAANTCSEWKLASGGDATFNKDELFEVAGLYDVTSPNESDVTYYCVFPDGEIAIANTETKIYSSIFLPSNQTPSSSTAVSPEEEISSDDQIRFCEKCGSPVSPDAHYCEKCGMRIR
ncbi:MAG: zinc ribbon domain-containing protein [Prevotellaceae bacterium]|nr:zinc ribbon domain-containing protein [Candidatus Minthosoma equi]